MASCHLRRTISIVRPSPVHAAQHSPLRRAALLCLKALPIGEWPLDLASILVSTSSADAVEMPAR